MVVKKLNEEMKACAKKVGIEVQMEAASRMTYTVAEWQHRVPESVNEVFDNLAGNLGVYYNDMTEPDDNAETMSISVGDPTSEIILTARTDSLEQNFFAPTETDDEECEDDEC
jgi:hypothetical protein